MNNINKNVKTSKALFFTTIVLSVSLALSGCDISETQEVTTFTNLVMSDEFDVEGAPNSALWTYDIGTGENGWGNQELQYYTDRTENVKVENGVLIISVLEEAFEGSRYTSTRLKTQGLFEQQYGRFEARMRLPYGKGLWPAFWLLGTNCIGQGDWPQCGEIDIMENAGARPSIVSGAVHGPGYSGGEAVFKAYDLVNERFDTGFHVFGIEWGPRYINYYVDDVLYNQITPDDVSGEWVFDQPFYIIINVAVGGTFDGPPNEETTFPQNLLVDYVRVYSNDRD